MFRKVAVLPSSDEIIQPNQLGPLGKTDLNAGIEFSFSQRAQVIVLYNFI
jgi:hypothetical protein